MTKPDQDEERLINQPTQTDNFDDWRKAFWAALDEGKSVAEAEEIAWKSRN